MDKNERIIHVRKMEWHGYIDGEELIGLLLKRILCTSIMTTNGSLHEGFCSGFCVWGRPTGEVGSLDREWPPRSSARCSTSVVLLCRRSENYRNFDLNCFRQCDQTYKMEAKHSG